MKIAFYKGINGTYIDKTICLATLSEYSHCELVLDDGYCVSSSKRDGGVRGKYIELSERWDVYELVTQYDQKFIRYWLSLNDHKKYDRLGAIGSAFGLDISSIRKAYCSQVCSALLELSGIFTPGELYRTLKRLDLIQSKNV